MTTSEKNWAALDYGDDVGAMTLKVWEQIISDLGLTKL